MADRATIHGPGERSKREKSLLLPVAGHPGPDRAAHSTSRLFERDQPEQVSISLRLAACEPSSLGLGLAFFHLAVMCTTVLR